MSQISSHHTLLLNVLSNLTELEAIILKTRIEAACADMLSKREMVIEMFANSAVSGEVYLDALQKIVELIKENEKTI